MTTVYPARRYSQRIKLQLILGSRSAASFATAPDKLGTALIKLVKLSRASFDVLTHTHTHTVKRSI